MKLIINDNATTAINVIDCTEVIRNPSEVGPTKEFLVRSSDDMDKVESALLNVVISNLKVQDDSNNILFETSKYNTFRDITHNISDNAKNVNISFGVAVIVIAN